MDNALGCIVGALVGDAAGAPLEFKKRITDEDINAAMHMNGGGVLNIGKGQITDDGELTVTLANKLTTAQGIFPLDNIAQGYSEWYKSMPFDCGTTCGKAFYKPNDLPKDKYLSHMFGVAAKYNYLSEANGALMRVTPIPIWAHREQNSVIAQYAKLDAMTSHPSQICIDCNSVYSVAIASLIRHKGNYKKTLEDTIDYTNSYIFSPVKEWVLQERLMYKESPEIVKKNIGHVKHAFCLAMNFLESPVSFEEGIKYTISQGGDTDTNAAICGGILGAIHGYEKIPDSMKNPVLNYKYSQSTLMGHSRPKEYSAKNVLKFVQSVFQ